MQPKGPLVSVLLSFLLLLPVSGVSHAEGGLRERLQRLGGQGEPTVAGVTLASAQLLDDFYRQRDYRYAWHRSRQVEDLLRLAEGSVDEGLQPRDFHAQQINHSIGGLPLSDFPSAARVDADILLSDSLLRLIHHRRYGKVDDARRVEEHQSHAKGADAERLVEDLQRAVLAEDLQVEVDGLVSRPAFYTRLKRGLARYRGIAATGGWPTVLPGKPLKPGMSDSRLPVMRERLRRTGDLKGPASNSSKYDEDLQAAVRAFQKRHHLGVDAVVGPATLAAMNISAEARVDQIRVNLERMRWVYDELPGDLLLVDIAAQQLQLLRDGDAVWTSRVIVGRPARPTPVFRDQLEYLEINPGWTVPPTILEEDILPAMRKDPGYLEKKGLQVVGYDGKPVAPDSVNWGVPAASFPYLIRQPPGEGNALGQIKFMFPNRFSVYLHDTPERSLFERPKRLYSSGCVRVEHPLELAELVLNDPKRWSRQQLEAIVGSERTRRVALDKPLPVILAYWTAEAGADGEVMFREDIYGRDAALLSALDGRGQIRVARRKPAWGMPGNTTTDPRNASSVRVTGSGGA